MESIKTIYDFYLESLETAIDIREHLPTLYGIAATCDRIVEFGIREGHSTAAFLAGSKGSYAGYDLAVTRRATLLVTSINDQHGPSVIFRKDSRDACIIECDLLFIDTLHTYNQVRAELRNGNAAQKWLIFHDTITNAIHGEDGQPGIMPAINEFTTANPHWKLWAHYPNNNGLTIYKRHQ